MFASVLFLNNNNNNNNNNININNKIKRTEIIIGTLSNDVKVTLES